MAIVVQGLSLEGFKVIDGVVPPTTTYDVYPATGVAANKFPVTSLLFQDGILSGGFWTFTTGAVGGTPALSIAIDWYHATGATSGNVRWGAQIAVIGSAAAGVINTTTKTLATSVFTNGAVPGTAYANQRTAIAATDGALFATANGPFVVALKVFRNGADAANDTANGLVKVRGITVLYQDT